ncbi:MAG: hypothetical protein ACJAZ2_000665 [Glaciecola sp.]|jgi:hypothetical protein
MQLILHINYICPPFIAGMKITIQKYILTALTVVLVTQSSQAQDADDQLERIGLNTITTAVPFLLITPDSRSGAMGDVGVATTPDPISSYWNNSKAAFAEKDIGLAFSYVPWLRSIVPDINLVYLSGYKKVSEKGALTAGMRYFSLGEINFTDESGNAIQTVEPKEFAFDMGYAHKLSEKFSGGFNLRYVNSNLTGGVSVGSVESKPARAIAADINGYYQSDLTLGDYDAQYTFGFNIQNIGNRVSYSESAELDFIPINLKLGNGLKLNFDEFNELGIYVDINKLLVPTPPVFLKDTAGNLIFDANGDPEIDKGKNPDVAVGTGMIQSFYDSPGGFSEEFQEINWSVGFEYWYDQQFALRLGYFYENPNKGNRQYLTMGIGIKYQIFNLDFSYLVPVDQRNPLENTLRFTLAFDLVSAKEKKAGKKN